ncbi:MAG: peptidoglycan DD-metalloendopeptidase family protein [Oscillospiraceae bacterium]|nr:peptidoglycan DD-metalloendopeptidase family protein [Oscillospiraceae bacterium]
MNNDSSEFNFIPPVPYKESLGKIERIEAAMVNVGALIAYTASYCASRAAAEIIKLAGLVKKNFNPVRSEVKKDFIAALKAVGIKFRDGAFAFAAFWKKFGERIRTEGFIQALKLQISDISSALNRNKSVFRSVVNYSVPVASIAVLGAVVYSTASTSYGIAVECNGLELGVVAAESVVADAQQTIADRAVYYSTEDEILVTASLSIKPLNAMNEVIDQVALADKMEEQISAASPEVEFSDGAEEAEVESVSIEAAADEAAAALTTDELEGKVRAYAVMINGDFYGAVEETSKIEAYVNGIKEQYQDEDVVSVGFDKSVEYSYEQYVYPSQIMSEDEIIDKLSSIVSEPVYYEVQDGDNPWNIATHNDMTVDELNDCVITYDGEMIDDITEYCPIGATIQLSAEVPFLQTLVTKSVTYTDEIDYDVVKTEDPDMYKGDSVVDVEGVPGTAEYTALITYKNGVAISKDIIDENIITMPVTQEMRVGTRETTTEVSTGSGGSGTYFWPVDGGYISAYQGDGRGHKGIDIAAPYGTPIYAAESGTVTRATNKHDGYGNSVMISHNDGNETMYAHMSSIAISYGDYVVRGQLIGYVGSTGDSTGNHLHFEVRSGGYYIDPTTYVSQY